MQTPKKKSENRSRALSWRNISSSWRTLWRARDELSLRNIRAPYLGYFLALPFLLALANLQNNFLRSSELLFGLNSLTLMYASCCVGAIIMMLTRFRFWDALSRTFAICSVVLLCVRLFLPDGRLSLLLLLVCWVGVGSCIAYAIYVYVFILNNTERLLGILLVVFSHGVFMCLVGAGITGVFLTHILPLLLMAGAAACMFSIKWERMASVPERSAGPPHPGIRLSVPFIVVAFVVDSASTFTFSQDSVSLSILNGYGIFAAVAVAVLFQVIFKQSVWHMWNLFLIIAFLSHVIILFQVPFAHEVAYFLHGAIYIGYVATCYTLGGINKKYNSLYGFRNSVALLFSVMVVALVVLGYMESHLPELIAVFTVIACGVMLIAFFLLTPLLQRHFFAPEWIDDYRSIDMLPPNEAAALVALERQGMIAELFEPEERTVALLMLEGQTQYEIARKLRRPSVEVGEVIGSICAKIAGADKPDPSIAAIIKGFRLTRREADMLRCLCQNMNNNEIAAELVLSEETVKSHMRHLMQKLPVNKRSDVKSWVEGF